MPKIFMIGKYIIYFWANEQGEPIHVHVDVKKPSENSAKIWLTKSGKAILASNKSEISKKELNKILDVISANFDMICSKWIEFFGSEIKFYC